MFNQLKNLINKQVKETGKESNVYRQIYFNAYPKEVHTCKNCQKEVYWNSQPKATVDHIVPQKLGGTNAITNLQILCQTCNSKKKDKIGLMTLNMSKDAIIREIKRITKW